jgi:hypothetical protein
MLRLGKYVVSYARDACRNECKFFRKVSINVVQSWPKLECITIVFGLSNLKFNANMFSDSRVATYGETD